MKTRFLVPAILAALLPLPVAAHIHLAPEEAARGSVLDIALVVGHGCKGQPTTGLRAALPAGLTLKALPEKAGWTATSAPGEVSWQGGSLPDHDKENFVVQVAVAPDAPAVLAIPVIQTCGDLQTRWIENASGADSPAPVLKITPAQ